MHVPSGQSPLVSGFTPRSAPVDRLFKKEEGDSGWSADIKDCFYSGPQGQKLLSKVTADNQRRYRQLVESAVAQGKLEAGEGEKRVADFQSGKLGPGGSPSVLTDLREAENDQFLLLHHNQQCADGLYRTQDYYLSPGTLHLSTLAQGWATSKDESGIDIPVADAVVVGAGPGGLTTAWQLARRGGRIVAFESELAGSAFSDAGAKPVHSMRTSADGTNLVQEGHAFSTLEHPLSLSGNLSSYRNLAQEGRRAESALTGEESHGVAAESEIADYRNAPASRGELFEHLAQLSHSLANDFPDAFLCERSPTRKITYADGLFTVETTRGHKVKARQLVLATGLTGPEGQRARMLPQFASIAAKYPEGLVMLGTEGDVSEQAGALSSGEKKPLVVHDRLLGNQAVRQNLSRLPDGSRVAVVGSGESAIKAALELLHLHPGLSVDLFAKDTVEIAQTQLPNENFHPAVLEGTLQNQEAAGRAFERYKLFGTPVTPRSMQELLELQSSGRFRLLEMGAYFDESTVKTELTDDGALKLEVTDPAVRSTLAEAHRNMVSKGLASGQSAPFTAADYRAVVQAVGYKKGSPENDPLSFLPEEARDKVHLNTAGHPFHPSQTSLAGLSTHGRQLAEILAQDIPEDRRVTITVPQDRGIDWRKTDPETVQGIIKYRGNHPGFAESVQREIDEFGDHPQALQLKLPATDEYVRDLYRKRESGTITPAEREVLERALKLAERMSQG